MVRSVKIIVEKYHRLVNTRQIEAAIFILFWAQIEATKFQTQTKLVYESTENLYSSLSI